jgi:hypothetical protein
MQTRMLSLAATAACALVVGTGTAMADDKPATGPFAEAQVAAFKSCMADMGFSTRPDLRDPAVRKAMWAALRECLPLLKTR